MVILYSMLGNPSKYQKYPIKRDNRDNPNPLRARTVDLFLMVDKYERLYHNRIASVGPTDAIVEMNANEQMEVKHATE